MTVLPETATDTAVEEMDLETFKEHRFWTALVRYSMYRENVSALKIRERYFDHFKNIDAAGEYVDEVQRWFAKSANVPSDVYMMAILESPGERTVKGKVRKTPASCLQIHHVSGIVEKSAQARFASALLAEPWLGVLGWLTDPNEDGKTPVKKTAVKITGAMAKRTGKKVANVSSETPSDALKVTKPKVSTLRARKRPATTQTPEEPAKKVVGKVGATKLVCKHCKPPKPMDSVRSLTMHIHAEHPEKIKR